ncbi:hypothetical protein RH915_03750 [Serpentinicella sp. ANB-PHB4]|uniref:hypothetical protein n=1 Tax=Serpentinicella sp. ANB-PHB4 TaxID=3074076 RepID=UPI00285E6373|nr:hypothetical protein [Serpentinicella sp. ANB-PHB4]MDR5658598.1 hypothetical protein [Serpentinicella sp. ANB-PHB4]
MSKTSRNGQDIIDESYNARDYNIVEKNMMNAYLMPLDMIRDKDALDSSHFNSEELKSLFSNLSSKNIFKSD